MKRLGRWVWRGVVVGSLIVCLTIVVMWAALDRKPAWVWWTRLERGEHGRELPHGYFITLGQGKLKGGKVWGDEPRFPDGRTIRENLRAMLEWTRTRYQEQLERARDPREPGSARERESIAVIERERDAQLSSFETRLRQQDEAYAWLTPGFHWQRLEPVPKGVLPPATWEWFGIEFRRSGSTSVGSRSLSVPIWMTVAATAIAPLIAGARWARQARRRRMGWCVACGYDLRASTDGCPECGDGRASVPPD